MRATALHPAVAAAPLVFALACVSVPKPAPPEPVAAPAEWTAASTAAGISAGEPIDRWWAEFGLPDLEERVEAVLAANRNLEAAAQRVAAAAAQARIAGAALRPQVSADLGGTRQRRNFIGFPIPGGQGGVLGTTTTTWSGGWSASWEADLWGRLGAGQSAAAARLGASEADLAAARLSLAGQTANAYFALMEAARQVDLATVTLDNRRSSRERIRRRFEAGLRPALDLRLARSREASAEAALAARHRALDAARRRLELLGSVYPAGSVAETAESSELTRPATEVPAGLPADLVRRRPDLVALERRLAAAGYEVAAARGALFPSLRLTGAGGRLSAEIEDLLDNDFSVWSLAAGLLQPLFQGGRLRAGVELAEARRAELGEVYAQTLLGAFAEVELALAAETSLDLQERSLETAKRESLAARRQAEERYAAGLTDVLAVLEAQRQAFETESRWLEVKRERLAARVDLHLALGGGWRKESK